MQEYKGIMGQSQWKSLLLVPGKNMDIESYVIVSVTEIV